MSNRFLCRDCRIDTKEIKEYYMIDNSIWHRYGTVGMLCIGCIEYRLGRELGKADFTLAPVNYTGKKSSRLTSRLERI